MERGSVGLAFPRIRPSIARGRFGFMKMIFISPWRGRTRFGCSMKMKTRSDLTLATDERILSIDHVCPQSRMLRVFPRLLNPAGWLPMIRGFMSQIVREVRFERYPGTVEKRCKPLSVQQTFPVGVSLLLETWKVEIVNRPSPESWPQADNCQRVVCSIHWELPCEKINFMWQTPTITRSKWLIFAEAVAVPWSALDSQVIVISKERLTNRPGSAMPANDCSLRIRTIMLSVSSSSMKISESRHLLSKVWHQQIPNQKQLTPEPNLKMPTKLPQRQFVSNQSKVTCNW